MSAMYYFSINDVIVIPEGTGVIIPHGFSDLCVAGGVTELDLSQMATDLPRPNVTVVHSTDSGSESVDVKVERDGKARQYHGKATSVAGAVGEVVRDILNDPVSAEWLP